MYQCIILVGGKGTRVGELTRSFPKPMIEVNGKPFLLYILDYVQRFVFKEIILLSSHGSEYLQDYFKDFKYIDARHLNESFDIHLNRSLKDVYLNCSKELIISTKYYSAKLNKIL